MFAKLTLHLKRNWAFEIEANVLRELIVDLSTVVKSQTYIFGNAFMKLQKFNLSPHAFVFFSN